MYQVRNSWNLNHFPDQMPVDVSNGNMRFNHQEHQWMALDLTATNLLLVPLKVGVMRPIISYLASVLKCGQLWLRFYGHKMGTHNFTWSSRYEWLVARILPMAHQAQLQRQHGTCGTVSSVSSPESLITLTSIGGPDRWTLPSLSGSEEDNDRSIIL